MVASQQNRAQESDADRGGSIEDLQAIHFTSAAAVPEPGVWAGFGTGLVVLAALTRRSRSRQFPR